MFFFLPSIQSMSIYMYFIYITLLFEITFIARINFWQIEELD